MLFRKDPRKQALLELAMKQVEKFLKDMQDEGVDLARMKIKKYQKTHFTNCTCPQCREADRKHKPHDRGILEDGYKVYVGEGAGEE